MSPYQVCRALCVETLQTKPIGNHETFTNVHLAMNANVGGWSPRNHAPKTLEDDQGIKVFLIITGSKTSISEKGTFNKF